MSGERAIENKLRAAISLSKVWQYQGRTGEACRLLSGTYSSFTEGFETADMREARKLLGIRKRAVRAKS